MRSPGRCVLLLILLALVLPGCRLRSTVEVHLDGDGAGRLEVVLAADAALAAAAREAGTDPLAELERRLAALDGEGRRTTARDTPDGGRLVTFSASFTGPEAFERLLDDFVRGLAAPELAPLGPFRLVRGDRKLRLEGVASLDPGPAVAELGLDRDRAVAALARAVDYRVRVSLPGEVLEHDASRAEGTVLEWVVPAGRRVELTAVGTRPSDRTLLLVVGGLAATGLAALALRRRPTPSPLPVARGDSGA